MKKSHFIICALIAVALFTGASANVYATSTYNSQFRSTYPGSGTSSFSCAICHNPASGSPSASTLYNYGSDFRSGGHNFKAIEPLDSDHDGYTNLVEINAGTNQSDPNSHPTSSTSPDITPPTVAVFTIPSASGNLAVPINSLAATDNVGVTGFMLTQTATKPSATATGWSATAPSIYSFSAAGTYTLYVWAKDAAGNVSASLSTTITITLSSTNPSGGGTSAISGAVKDIGTGAVLSGAVVSDGTRSATTSSTGTYTLSEPAGTYTLKISKSGYLTTYQVATVTPGMTKTVNWALTKNYGSQAIPAAKMSYVILAWNDLGMHCDQDDYSYFAVLPPFQYPPRAGISAAAAKRQPLLPAA